jgi:hypothetical protein
MAAELPCRGLYLKCVVTTYSNVAQSHLTHDNMSPASLRPSKLEYLQLPLTDCLCSHLRLLVNYSHKGIKRSVQRTIPRQLQWVSVT